MNIFTNLIIPALAFPTLRKLLGGDPEKVEFENLGAIVSSVTEWATIVAGSVALIYFIYGGIVYMTSAGDTGRTEQGKKTITWSLVGLVVVISAYAIVKYFARIFITNPGI